ncbi:MULTISPECIES: YceI family protein [Allobranchiibius]|uniref:Polyisoprenoid-binding protein YceI n=1 Tax=Allobranchiibius huperziae TaxID=1874116 RepID=A0A853DPN8_9MICO|nr:MULTISPECIES: YceI family protein [Allobranchiibius]MBO1767184.1 polyisoprenoid-binding protein [Allobranchiibius sp. GilTou38]NYJ76085.1 polyisoprenoid-binding protein YceI [Allobranchiibius huperziae]UIJ35811.1 YceI family protein [Allobranchiibius sp. GilTou73]
MSTALKDLNGTYTIDPAHSELGFVARHAMVTKVRGSFKDIEGTATSGAGLSDAKIDITIQVASVDTRDENRDGHLRTGDFFEVEKFPTMTFHSTDVTAVDDDTLRVVGDLTIKETTKSVTIDFDYNGSATDPFGNERVGFEGSTTITRSDYGINFNAALETGGVLVSDKITLQIEISAIKQA